VTRSMIVTKLERFDGSVRKYHLKHSRKNAAVGGLIVKKPRHFIVYRVNGDTLEILRVLHDRMDLPRQMGGH
jgi:toxin ParE1/3/4